jgi:hypothetical protein
MDDLLGTFVPTAGSSPAAGRSGDCRRGPVDPVAGGRSGSGRDQLDLLAGGRSARCDYPRPGSFVAPSVIPNLPSVGEGRRLVCATLDA